MGKTKAVELSQEQRTELEKGYKNGKRHAFRTRCQMVLLKSEKRTSVEVAECLGCCEVVVNNWLKRFEAEGIKGLETRAGRGRPPILSQQNPEHLQKVKAEIKKHPNSVKTVVAVLEDDLQLQMHPETLETLSKKNGYRFCRARTWLKSRQVGAEREEKEALLNRLWQFYQLGLIDLCFGDESAFSMNPKLPYGWSPAGERIKIFPQRDKKINLFGVFQPDNFCLTYESMENINSDFLIRSIDDFCGYLEKPTVLVLDNAPTHRSEKFLSAVEKWLEKDLYIFFLPKYSPHLNLAETFWRKAKYEWLRPGDYGSFVKYKQKIKHIFNNIGLEYKIQFHQMMV